MTVLYWNKLSEVLNCHLQDITENTVAVTSVFIANSFKHNFPELIQGVPKNMGVK